MRVMVPEYRFLAAEREWVTGCGMNETVEANGKICPHMITQGWVSSVALYAAHFTLANSSPT